MTILEIPLGSDLHQPHEPEATEVRETSPNNSENVLENSFKNPEIINENEELNSQEQPIEEIPEIVEDVPAPKRPRGRPKGSTKAKEAAPQKPQKAPKQPKQPKPKKAPPRRVDIYESSEEEEEELPDYVRQEVRVPEPPRPTQADLAAQMLRLLQNHENVRTQRKRNLYGSWFQHHY